MLNKTPGVKKVKSITLKVGLLSLVDSDALKFALKIAAKSTPVEGAHINIILVKPRFSCRECGYEWTISQDSLNKLSEKFDLTPTLHLYPDIIVRFLKCPSCGSNDVEIIEGRGVILESIELDV
ncbi:MAG: hydrogenase maturation nickel metallochaperone HypA [Desulfurococcales archaeon]|nr:hydrogenase maturation nickel metallochaperone HypA [Desulfurococcales archaeon]